MRSIAVLRILALCLASLPARAWQVNDHLAVDTAMHSFVQYGNYSHAIDGDGKRLHDKTGAVGILDLATELRPAPTDELYARARFVKGNGLNKFEGEAHAPYGGDLHDDVKDINGSNRDYLLEAWYRHSFRLASDTRLAASAGIIDSTRYIDENAYANDPDSQFMNEVFSNNNLPSFPSYSGGGALELESGHWSLHAVYMRLKNDQDRNYNYHAGQLGYRLSTRLGEGNYRLFGFLTNNRFDNARGNRANKRLNGFGVSVDQQLGDTWGVFLRGGHQGNDAAVEFDRQFSFGVNVNGRLWQRPQDEFGLAWSWLGGTDTSKFDDTRVAEAYVRFQLIDHADLSFDLQYEKDSMAGHRDRDPSLWVVGTRINAWF